MKNYILIKFWQIAKYLIIKKYGKGCPTKDYIDNWNFAKLGDKKGKNLEIYFRNGASCDQCRAVEVIYFIDYQIALLKI